jgi:hypothetical protein
LGDVFFQMIHVAFPSYPGLKPWAIIECPFGASLYPGLKPWAIIEYPFLHLPTQG